METFVNAMGTSVPSTKILLFVLAMTLKCSCILIGVSILTRGLRRASSASRHLIWGMTLGGILIFPVFNLLLPAWILPLPASLSSVLPQNPEMILNGETTENSSTSSEHQDSKTNTVTSTTVTGEYPERKAEIEPLPRPLQKSNTIQSLITAMKKYGTFILVSIWITGMVFIFLRHLLGKILIWRIASRAETVTESDWLHVTCTLKKKYGLRRQIRLLRSEKTTLPMTWGFLRPTILLPAETNTWSDEQRKFVLLHELAHVKRWDCLTQLIAQLAVVLHWFNPLVWFAHRQFLKEREHACDDEVLEQGSVPSEYAGLLLEIAQSLSRLRFPCLATVAMARRSQLEGRLLAILDPRIRRRALTRLTVFLAGFAVFTIVLPLAAMYPVSTTETPEGIETQLYSTGEQGIQTEPGLKDPPRKSTTGENADQASSAQNIDDPIIQSLSEVLQDPSLEVRLQAAETLGKMENPAAVRPLISALKDENWEMRATVAEALGDIKDKAAVEALVEIMKDTNWQVRQAAAEALGYIEDARAVEPLGKALKDENRNVRSAVVQALEEIEDPSALEPLIGALDDEDWVIRREAADALGSLTDPAAIGPLSRLLQDSHWEVRKAAVEALGDIEDRRIISPLSQALKDSNWEIRVAAAEALGDIDDFSVLDPLSTAIHDENSEVLKTVIEALGDIENPKAIPLLLPLLNDTRWEIRAKTATALGEIEDPKPVPELSRHLKDVNREVRLKVIWALGEIGDHRAVDSLIDVLNDGDWEIRKVAAWALGEIGDSRALEPLSQILKDENENVRQEAAKALGEIRWNGK